MLSREDYLFTTDEGKPLAVRAPTLGCGLVASEWQCGIPPAVEKKWRRVAGISGTFGA